MVVFVLNISWGIGVALPRVLYSTLLSTYLAKRSETTINKNNNNRDHFFVHYGAFLGRGMGWADIFLPFLSFLVSAPFFSLEWGWDWMGWDGYERE